MKKISCVRDGGYFFIEKLAMVEETFLHIYGSLSTIYKVNVNIKILSKFKIHKIFGQEEMYKWSLTNISPYTFNSNIIHFKYGKTYSFVTLVDIPENTPYGTEVLSAEVSFINKTFYFYWDENYNSENNYYDSFAYEEYIKGIFLIFLQKYIMLGKLKEKPLFKQELHG